MKEDLLHFIWKYQRFSKSELKTTDEQSLVVHKLGTHNTDLGAPDFLNAQISIGGQRWAGNIEIHVKASDWYAHSHQNDPNYSSVILHVVWEYDVEVFNMHDQVIPVVELSHFVQPQLLEEYKTLSKNKKGWIPCESLLINIDDFTWNNWLERMFIERLEYKSVLVHQLLKETNNDWEAVCFALLAKSFGGNINGDDFVNVALSIPSTIFQKTNNETVLEAIFMGQSNMLIDSIDDPYYKILQKEFQFARYKYQLDVLKTVKMNFFKLRPPNFPTIRISQLTSLYAKNSNLFNKLIQENELSKIYDLMSCNATDFWDTHYTFNKSSTKRVKKLSASMIDLVIINAILPLRFTYQKHYGKFEEERFLNFFKDLKPEQNTVVNKFRSLGKEVFNAVDSQAIIHLKKKYCDNKKCLECNIGCKILSL